MRIRDLTIIIMLFTSSCVSAEGVLEDFQPQPKTVELKVFERLEADALTALARHNSRFIFCTKGEEKLDASVIDGIDVDNSKLIDALLVVRGLLLKKCSEELSNRLYASYSRLRYAAAQYSIEYDEEASIIADQISLFNFLYIRNVEREIRYPAYQETITELQSIPELQKPFDVRHLINELCKKRTGMILCPY